MNYSENNKRKNASQLVNGASNIGAVCLSFLLLPMIIDFPEDFETLFSSFETALSLRILISWVSIWFTLTYTFRGVLGMIVYALKRMERFLSKSLSVFIHEPFKVKPNTEHLYQQHHGVPEEQEIGEDSSKKIFGKGFKFPTFIPKKLLKKFQIKLKQFGNIGFSNGMSIWKFKLKSNFLSKDKSHKRMSSKGLASSDKHKQGKKVKIKSGKGGTKGKVKKMLKAKVAAPKKAAIKKIGTIAKVIKVTKAASKGIAKPSKVIKAPSVAKKKATLKALKAGKDFFKKVTAKHVKAATKTEKTHKEHLKKETKAINYNAVKTAAKFYAKQQQKSQDKAKKAATHFKQESRSQSHKH